MPRYYYHCNNCREDFFIHPSMDEKQRDCSLCESTDISKLLTKPLSLVFEKKNKNSAGQLTKKYIEENKEVLEKLKKEIRKEEK